MERELLISKLKEFFDIKELVCSHTYEKFGSKSWQFLDRDLLEALLIVRRDILKMPMVVNNYHTGGDFSQRGFRCNICRIPKDKTLKGQLYLSAHCNGAAIDFDAKGLTVSEVHQKIKDNTVLLPCKVRMEANVTWNHLDVYSDPSKDKFSEFSV